MTHLDTEMVTEETLPPNLVRRRLYTSHTYHLVDTAAPQHPDHSQPASLCGVRPFWPGVWLEWDPSSDAEICDCRSCKNAKEAAFSVEP